MRSQPLAFMSYSHFDDDNDNGYLTKFCKKLSKEVRAHTGKDFPIFQDRKDIKWGENWKERINGSLQSATFLIPIISPNFFESKNCREELKQFIEYEKDLNRNDLILPIYYISCPQIENIDPEDNKLAETIRASQWRDWRNLRNKSFNQSRVKGELANLAIEIRDSISYPQKTTFENPNPLTATINNGEKEKNGNKLGPRTLIVDKNQSCHYTKINDAINDANPGDRILIYPGIYQEGLILSQPLEITGEGALGSIVVQAAGQSVLLFKTNRGHIANLVLEQKGGGNWFCIDIAQGSLELEGCDVTSQGSSCVAIHDNARPLLKHNRIHHSKQSGILVFDNGKGILEDNEIFENNFAGIEIRNFGNPILRHNIIRNGKQNGILVYDNGRGTFEDNDIFESEFPQIGILLYGNPFSVITAYTMVNKTAFLYLPKFWGYLKIMTYLVMNIHKSPLNQ
ncbi:MAG: right-handed parallel beta-helix repeat-containing protein [Methanotrichaceae archaeon]|jgi:F-box protein 11